MHRAHIKSALIWCCVSAALIVPLAIAATSPLLAWREPIYIISGLAGIIGLGVLLLQPLLGAGFLPGLSATRARFIHRWLGASLVVLVIVHVGGLWLTSPPDVIDALLLRSPTPFSLWGVIAMWAVFVAAVVAISRRRLRPRIWRYVHTGLAIVIIIGSSAHALLIDGTMGTVSKAALCVLVVAATTKLLLTRRRWRYRG